MHTIFPCNLVPSIVSHLRTNMIDFQLLINHQIVFANFAKNCLLFGAFWDVIFLWVQVMYDKRVTATAGCLETHLREWWPFALPWHPCNRFTFDCFYFTGRSTLQVLSSCFESVSHQWRFVKLKQHDPRHLCCNLLKMGHESTALPLLSAGCKDCQFS